MGTTTVSDYVIWAKQIHDADDITGRILDLGPGETIDLVVDGTRGVWRKMDEGRDGRPVRGIRPLGRTKDLWGALYSARRGDVVTVELPNDPPFARSSALVSPPIGRTEDERRAALEALLELGRQGWRSDGAYGPREDLYDRP